MPLTASSALSKDKRTANARPQLQHRHFAFIAATIRSLRDQGWTEGQLYGLAHHFANKLAQTNPNFSRERFEKAVMD